MTEAQDWRMTNPIFKWFEQYKESFSSPEIRDDEEGKSHIIFILLLVWSGRFFYDWSHDWIYIQKVSGWTRKDIFVHLGYIFKFNSFLDVLDLKFSKDIDYSPYELENISVKTFFKKNLFLKLPDDVLSGISFYPKPKYETIVKEVMNTAVDELEYVNFYSYYKFWNFQEHSKRIYEIFENLYNLHGDEFEISQKPFMKYPGMRFTDTIILFYFAGFIKVTSIGFGDTIIENDTRIPKPYYHHFGIQITEKFKEMIEASIERKTLLMDSFLEDEYKRVSLSRKNGKPHLLERELDVLWDETKFTELRKKYPHSDIKAVNYNGKTMKYEIKEKIRFDK